MSKEPVELIIASFASEDAAQKAYDFLRKAQNDKIIGVVDLAILRRDHENKLHIKETGDVGGGKGAAVGATVGAIMGVIGGPIGVMVLGSAGAAVGGLAGKFIDSGIPDERLKDIGDSLKPGTSALVAIIELTASGAVRDQLATLDAEVLEQELKQELVNGVVLRTDDDGAAVDAETI